MIPIDKQLHALAGMALAAAFFPFGLIASVVIVIVAAVGKELRDSLGYGTPDAWDAGATICGGALMLSWLEFACRYLAATL